MIIIGGSFFTCPKAAILRSRFGGTAAHDVQFNCSHSKLFEESSQRILGSLGLQLDLSLCGVFVSLILLFDMELSAGRPRRISSGSPSKRARSESTMLAEELEGAERGRRSPREETREENSLLLLDLASEVPIRSISSHLATPRHLVAMCAPRFG